MEDRRREAGQDPGTTPANRAAPPMADPAAEPTADQLRDDIDSGRTHDKVAKSDPAAAPLGTDDEASGNPPTAGQVSTARSHETGRTVPGQPSASRAASHTASRANPAIMWAIIGAVLVAIVLAFVF